MFACFSQLDLYTQIYKYLIFSKDHFLSLTNGFILKSDNRGYVCVYYKNNKHESLPIDFSYQYFSEVIYRYISKAEIEYIKKFDFEKELIRRAQDV